MLEIEEWFKTKKYPHIGLPIRIKHYNRVKLYVENPAKIRKHSFLPFIHKTIIKRKFRANKITESKNPSRKRERIKGTPKIRDTFFASHLDAMVFSRYNYMLSKAYEDKIQNERFNESIVAYRKLAREQDNAGNKCNIDFAKTAFEYILNNKQRKLSVIIADVTSFFDNLNHSILKKNWARVLNQNTLPPDHYNVFKALTRIKYVESQQLFDAYDQTMLVERGVPSSSTKKEIVRKKINGPKYFKEKKAIAYCEKDEFIKSNLNLIISKGNKKGIPQGSPLSATLANIYMIDFDRIIFEKVDGVNGFYQRYSDDLIIVCERQYEDDIVQTLRETIKSNVARLEIQPAKTKLYHFESINNVFVGFEVDESTREIFRNIPLEYLGFSFDGKRVLIKTSGFSKFHRTMKGAFKRAHSFAIHGRNPDKSIFKSKLFKRFTYKGAKRKMKFRPLDGNTRHFAKTKEYNWGNYLTYIYKADEEMLTLNMTSIIKRQSRKIWPRFNKLMKQSETSLAGRVRYRASDPES